MQWNSSYKETLVFSDLIYVRNFKKNNLFLTYLSFSIREMTEVFYFNYKDSHKEKEKKNGATMEAI